MHFWWQEKQYRTLIESVLHQINTSVTPASHAPMPIDVRYQHYIDEGSILFLKQNGYRPQQVQDFIPAPMDIAACMYHTGLDPLTKKEVYVAKYLRDRKLQRALMQFFKPENYFLVRKALIQAGREELIGNGCNALIPIKAPPEAIEARRHDAQHENHDGDHVHSRHRMPKRTSRHNAQSSTGYRPGRRGATKRKS